MALTDLYPDWAYARVREIVDAQTKDGWHDKFLPIGARNAFAKYIAEHEVAPVDPLLIEARSICAEHWDGRGHHAFADKVIAGSCDDQSDVSSALAALRRGIEIGKAS